MALIPSFGFCARKDIYREKAAHCKAVLLSGRAAVSDPIPRTGVARLKISSMVYVESMSTTDRGNPMIRLEEVTKIYQQGTRLVTALDTISLEVGTGEFVSIMGPSGSGKSTLLHIMGTLDAPTRGKVWIGGELLSELSDRDRTIFRRKKIGFVFQFFNLLPGLTAEENVALPLMLDGKKLSQHRDRIEALLERVGLAHRRGHRPDELSGGEMQRVAIARALIIQPLVLLADEPTGNLDSKTGSEILELIAEINAAEKTTVVLVTHDPSAAARAGRRLSLRDGTIVSDVRA